MATEARWTQRAPRYSLKFRAELEGTAGDGEQQTRSTYLPGQRASAPKQLLTPLHNNNRLAGADTERGGWQRSVCAAHPLT